VSGDTLVTAGMSDRRCMDGSKDDWLVGWINLEMTEWIEN